MKKGRIRKERHKKRRKMRQNEQKLLRRGEIRKKKRI